MIPFALKQAWFWFALAGLVQCWITLVVCPGRKYGGLWARLYYCIFLTLLEGMFCLGLIWHMDPGRMPHSFCTAQVISFSLASFALTGLSASITVASARAVFHPEIFDNGRAVLAWHPRYIPLVVFFPVAACAVHSTLLVTRHAVRPSLSDDLHCDATDPMWMRLVGYAGVPLIVTIPFLVLSIFTAFRLFKMMYNPPTDETCSSSHVYYDESLSPDDFSGQRRQTHRLTAFLPYPTKVMLNRSEALVPASSVASVHHDEGVKQQYPLHKHPFPPVDPLTGKAYSPSIEEDAIPCTTITAPVHVGNARHPFDHPHINNHTLNVSPPERSRRVGSSTPDSAFSSTMPIFASNPSLPTGQLQANRTSLHLQVGGEGSDMQVGLALTTGDSPSGSGMGDGDKVDDGSVKVGIAITTDEPDFRTPTPTSTLRLKTPSFLNIARASPTPSDIQIVHDTQRPQDAVSQHGVHPLMPDFGRGMASGDRTQSSESITRTLTSPQHSLSHLAHTSYPAPHALFSSGPSATQISSNQPQASFVSSSPTFYSMPYSFRDREERDLLPFSPASAASFQSPMTPEDMGIDLVLDTGLRHPEIRVRDHDEDHDDGRKVGVCTSWDDDEALDVQGVMRTVKARDPRVRLGMYNPNPAMPAATIFEQPRRRLRRNHRVQMQRSAKLGKALGRLVLFQIAFFAVQLLASLSSILDVVHGRITPFGTQHVALLLAAWGPLVIFGRTPRRCRLWRRRE